ncbi:transmembrane protein 138-like isoform X1 [Diadema antillarum]|uniref:transmembrane protein 138-like isoform X1 n=1 Tax=Diadema antillarum TaxID=105358 RepID=UPI003A8672F5
MQVSQYRGVLYLQYFLLFVDLFVNAFCDLLRLDNVTQLVLFIIQDISQIFATIVMFLMFFNTYVFQAGLVGYLITKFKFTIAILFLYFMLCVGLHIWTVTLRWNNVDAYIWHNGYQALYVFQRVGKSVLLKFLPLVLSLPKNEIGIMYGILAKGNDKFKKAEKSGQTGQSLK